MLKGLDKKQKMEVIITGIGIIFLIFLIIDNVQKVQKKKMSIIKADKEVASSLSASIPLEKAEVEKSNIKEGWGRDPFSSAMSSAADLEDLSLNGIMWDRASPYAIINGDVVKVGDKIGNATVIEINQKNVILEQDTKRHTLQLNVF